MNSQNVSDKQVVIDILSEKIHVPKCVLKEENWDTPLTGKIIKINAVDLAYVFFEIEKAFGIHISEEYLNKYGFNSINNITAIIENSLRR